MRRAIWMALAFMGTAPLMVLAQQTGGAQAPATQQPAASPSGTAGFQQGQDTTGAGTPGAPGQQAAGAIGTTQGEPAAGGGGTGGGGGGDQGVGGAGTGGDVQGGGNRLDGAPLQRPDAAGGQGLSGGTGTGGGGGTVGPTYRGTTETTPPAAAPLDVGSQVGPEPGERAGTSGTGTVGAGAGTGGTGTGGGQASAPVGQDAMGRELSLLRERVTRLEAQVNSLGQGGGGTGGGGDTAGGTAGGGATAGGARDDGDIDPEDIRLEGPVAVANVTFDGTVREVSRGRLVIVDNSDGSLYSPVIDKQTKVFKGEELNRISPRQLAEGTPVRVSLDLIGGVEHARNIIALEPEQQQPRQGQGQRQGQGARQQAPSPQPQIDLPRRGGGMR